jgi:hypothetical protein
MNTPCQGLSGCTKGEEEGPMGLGGLREGHIQIKQTNAYLNTHTHIYRLTQTHQLVSSLLNVISNTPPKYNTYLIVKDYHAQWIFSIKECTPG